jgi:hypothetical protein
MSLSQRARRSQAVRDESGAALIITLMVILLVGTLAGTVTSVTITNLQSSQHAQQAGVAVNAADAGLSEGVSYLRTNGVSALCGKPTSYTPSTGVFNQAFDLATKTCVNSEQLGTRVAGRPYSVLIVTEVSQTLQFRGGSPSTPRDSAPEKPAGVSQRQLRWQERGAQGLLRASDHGRWKHHRQSEHLLDRMRLQAIEHHDDRHRCLRPPVAVHTSRIITDDQGTLPTCRRAGWRSRDQSRDVTAFGAPLYPFDQDALGGDFPSGSPCFAARASYPKSASDTWNTTTRTAPRSPTTRLSSRCSGSRTLPSPSSRSTTCAASPIAGEPEIQQ